MEESDLQALAERVAAGIPRLIVVAAPPGYRKGAFVRAYAARTGRVAVCDLVPGDAADLARPVLDALAAGAPQRAARAVAGRLAGPPEAAAATSRAALRREWPAPGPELFVLRDPAGVLATPAGADLFGELVAALPEERTLVLSVRVPLPPALHKPAAAERTVWLGPADLALDAAAVEELARDANLPAGAGSAVYEICAGWPLVSRLLVDVLRHDAAAPVVEAARALPAAGLLAFAAHRTIARLGAAVRDALIVAALRPGVTHDDIVRVLGDACDDLVIAGVTSLPFVTLAGAGIVVHPEIVQLLRTRFHTAFVPLYERTVHVLTGDGEYGPAARVALANGDAGRAAAIVDAAPPYTAAPVPLGEYERVIDRIDRRLIARYPNLWIATIPSRMFAVGLETFTREAETVYHCLPFAANPDQRAAAVMLLANAYVAVGRVGEADALIGEALAGFARAPSQARAALLNFSASVRGIEGRFRMARALAAEAAALWRDGFGENQTLHYIKAHEAAYGGKVAQATVILDELVRRRAEEELPLYVVHAATSGAFFAWASGDDGTFERYLALMEEALTPGLDRGFAPIIDAAHGRATPIDERYVWPSAAALAELYRLGHARDRSEALAAARAAARHADRRRDPYLQILAHAALFTLAEAARADEAAALAALAAEFESPEMRAAVAALVRGEPAGMLEPFVRRRVLREREGGPAAPRLEVELVAGRVTRDGTVLRLSDKELELLALLATARAPLSRERIGEALWDHLDPEEWPNNLKVTLSRLRTKLGVRDAVIAGEGRYRLSGEVEVDLRRAEALVRAYAVRPLDDSARAEFRALLAARRSGSEGRYDGFSWSRSLLTRIDDAVSEAGTALAHDALANGRYDDALLYARDVAAVDPLSEAACEVTIRALRARGDGDGARREFRRYAGALAEELGTQPSQRLAELLSGGALPRESEATAPAASRSRPPSDR